ncbi:Predicted Zn-dependent peptidase [Austwickia chelonae]|uniref:Peptidase M16 family protein n=1 Tax=Austwickia chelonae NBRC 105200 TaxID=1184607 RepID=K6VNJ8_9MICO|nr:pitrilysin family protein [Austwickia chelonae]GAB78314.1 peptidase M16 family protein [Austwickia chelonae NBRC 105200]SEW01080.1 Predicted Zn-dependent peptidase [Austwickia chelonae]
MPLAYDIVDRTLPNGLRVVVNEDHSVPTVAVNIWVRVGSRHEPPGKTGFAHLFEHLMFQGSRQIACGEHFATLMAHGARLNATTWFDRTNYFDTVPSGAFELALWMEADRHGWLLDAVNQENLDNQRDVVKEEKRQRYDNAPYGNALNHLYGLIFPDGHPYQHPTIGSMADLDAATLEDVHAFYRHWYVPGNTVLTVAGDITAEEAFRAAERYFGVIPAGELPEQPVSAPLRPLPAPVRGEWTEAVPSDRLYIGFRLPPDHTADYLAASCAVDCLGGLSISRLERALVRDEELADFVSAGSLGLFDGVSLGYLVVQAADGVDLDRLETRLCELVDDFAEQGPTSVDMEAVLAQSERSWLSGLASLEERADTIGQYTCLHDDPHAVNTYLDRLSAVTADQVREAARTWLRSGHRAVVAVRPQGEDA